MAAYVSYLVTNVHNGKRYVGITKKSHEERWKRHIADARSGSELLLHRAMRKYGVESFNVVVLDSYDTLSAAKAGETSLIEEHASFAFEHPDTGYNMTKGGDGAWGYRFSSEQRQHLSELATLKNGMRGKKHTEETKLRMSETHKQHVYSEHELEHRRERARAVGIRNKGKRHTDEAKRKMSELRKVPVVQLNMTGETIARHASALDAELATGVKHQHIYRCCRGLRKSSGGYAWKYEDVNRVYTVHSE